MEATTGLGVDNDPVLELLPGLVDLFTDVKLTVVDVHLLLVADTDPGWWHFMGLNLGILLLGDFDSPLRLGL